MLPFLQAAEHGQPKCGVLGESLWSPPNPTLRFPSLSLQTTRTGRILSPQTATSLNCNKTGGGRGPGDKLNFWDDFFFLDFFF